MKYKNLLILALMVISTNSFAYFEEHYNYIDAKNKITMKVDTRNRPDFEIAYYDSDNTAETASVDLSLIVLGKKTTGSVKVSSYVPSTKITNIIVSGSNNTKCVIGSNEKGVKVSASVKTSQSNIDAHFICTNQIIFPQGAVECE